MTLSQSFLQELLHEAGNTRKMLGAMSDDVLDFKPHEKSRTMGQLASHITGIYNLYPFILRGNQIDFSAYKYDPGDISKVESILAKFEENLKKAVASLEALPDDSHFSENYRMMMGEVEVASMPRAAAVRNMLMNHLYHHRGQLSVYLRAAGKKVPGIYGPSGDER